MLRTAQISQTLSTYTYLWGQHEYNENPFASLGCKVKTHITPIVQETWAPHTATAYYISNAKEHCRWHQVYITNLKHFRTCKTVFFKHKYLNMWSITMADVALIKAADNLVDTITGQLPRNSTTTQVVELMDIFKVQVKKATCKQEHNWSYENKPKLKGSILKLKGWWQMNISNRHQPSTNIPNLETEDITNHNITRNWGAPMISQDNGNNNDYACPLSANMQQQCQTQTLTQEYTLHMMELLAEKLPHSCHNKQPCANTHYNGQRSTRWQNRGFTGILPPHC